MLFLRIYFPLIHFFVFTSISYPQIAPYIVISEFATRGGSIGNQAGEFVEIYNPTDSSINISEWRLEYKAAAGQSYQVLTIVPPGTAIRARSFFLFASASWAGSPAADLSLGGSGLADNGNLRLVNQNGNVIDRVGYGTGNDPEGNSAPNHGSDANDYSVERKASAASTAASLAAGGDEEFAGNGWDSDNNADDFVLQINGRNPQNSFSPAEPQHREGSGMARISNVGIRGGAVFDLSMLFYPSAQFSIDVLALVLPPGFTWSYDVADVNTDGGLQADIMIAADTIFFRNTRFSGDSTVITLNRITAPENTGRYSFAVLTGLYDLIRLIGQPPVLYVKGTPLPIAEMRTNDEAGVPVKLNDFITVNGVVTVANQFSQLSFIQDHSGGIAVFDEGFSISVAIGDEVTVTGKLTMFNGLAELTEVTVDARSSSGNEISPLPVTLQELLSDGENGVEVYEGRLVRVNGVMVNTEVWAVTGAGTNYVLSDGINEFEIRIDKNSALVGQPAPGGSFDLVGVISQHKNSSPFIGGYQIMPRFPSDVVANGPRILSQPEETDIRPEQITIRWGTGLPAHAYVRYGRTAAYEDGTQRSEKSAATQQEVTLTGLEAATIYCVQPFSVANGDTSFAQPFYISTASQNSTGEIIVSFNQSADHSLFPRLPASAGVNLLDRLLHRIEAAQYSIDICLYSLSGLPGEQIIDRLIEAVGRGVRVRAIVEADNGAGNTMRRLFEHIPAISDSYDSTNSGIGLQHNKFVIFDNRDNSSDTDDWVLTGSWNPTHSGTYDDAQNVIEIQDQALAAAFTREFEEMWGSSGDSAISSTSRFGARKTDNTPHHFVIGQNRIPVELYFSPSDNVSARIIRELRRARSSIYFAIFTFTRDDIARVMLDRKNAAVAVRGVVDNNSDQGSRYDYLYGKGVDVLLKKGVRGLLHHKYLLVDADDRTPRVASVLTGSHNWTNAAEFSNNENTLIIRDADIAVQYLQEWYKRYRDAGGTEIIVLSAEESPAVGETPSIRDVWPNPVPAGAVLNLSFELPSAMPYSLLLEDVLGRHITELEQGEAYGMKRYLTVGTAGLSPGVYILRLLTNAPVKTRKIIVY